ncbi:MAG TPA: DoxX family protein [Oligoflexus sp.]|uniref:DoxX family protein n=1 Tax=Oligoflexus sp. TaxID=1971216 RepID=UPI002D6A926D|nr:DoxX family protein [Oligoflexus sp.]HYX34446.1 DoxX family protein [Oligoflexus sp.]
MKAIFRPLTLPDPTSLGLLLLRLLVGVAMMMHGWSKIQSPFGWMGPDAPVPGFLQGLAALAEFGGGLAWVLGLVMPLASLGVAITMAVAVYFHAGVKGDPFIGPSGSYELASVYCVIALLFILTGPGRYALDDKIFRREP